MKERSIQEAVINHAQRDLSAMPSASHDTETGLIGRFKAWRDHNFATLPRLSDEIFPMFREMVKDIRQTVNEVFFNHHEHAPEPGAPMNPTQIMVTDELRPDSFNHESYDHVMSGYAGRGRDDSDGGISR